MPLNMKSVMIFDPKDSDEETYKKWYKWNEYKSAVADKHVPNAKKTRELLRK